MKSETIAASPKVTAYWDRRLDEPEAAYRAFLAFRDLGGERTILAAYRASTGRAQAKRPSKMWESWADRFDWAVRAGLWDLERASAELDARAREHWKRRRLEIARGVVEDADRLMALVDTTPVGGEGSGPTISIRDILGVSEIALAFRLEVIRILSGGPENPAEPKRPRRRKGDTRPFETGKAPGRPPAGLRREVRGPIQAGKGLADLGEVAGDGHRLRCRVSRETESG